MKFSWIGAVRRVGAFFVSSIFTFATLAAASAVQGATVVGSLPGSFGVSATGAATYSIPIALPRGSGGLTPSIALVYNSQSGDGAAGYGWTLSGLSAISRCNKTIHDDGGTEGVSLTASDDYCLDGERLILKSDGTYDTEIESFSRITATTGTNGPASFTVQTKNGETWEYGVTTDSKILATGTSTVRVWALDKVTDTNDNYYTITYQNNDTTTGDFWPTEIDYTGNSGAGTTPLHSVKFTWQPRSAANVRARYLQGTLITQTQLLHTIEVGYNGGTTFTYTLSYQTDLATQQNQLNTVTECAADGSCYAPTTVAWQSGAAGWGSDQTVNNATITDPSLLQYAHLMDIDGDGLQDLVFPKYSATDSKYYWWVAFGLSTGGLGGAVDSGVEAINYQDSRAINYRGNGQLALIYPDPSDNKWHILESNGDKATDDVFKAAASTGISDVYGSGPSPDVGLQIVDYWGHGLSDIVYSDDSYTYVLTNTGGGFSSQQILTVPHVWSKIGPAGTGVTTASEFTDDTLDFDGSGRGGTIALSVMDGTTTCTPDYCPNSVPPTYTWNVLVPDGTTTSPGYATVAAISGASTQPAPFPMNFKGDGTSDLALETPGPSDSGYNSFAFYLDTGASLTSMGGVTVDAPTQADPNVPDPIAADYYGNGRQEFLYERSGSWLLFGIEADPASGQPYSYGTNISAPYPSTYTPGSLRIGSIDSDGLDDLVYAVQGTNAQGATIYTWHYELHSGRSTTGGKVTDHVTSIVDGMGNTWQPAYASMLNGGTTYALSVPAANASTYGAGATTYTVQNASIPLQVVSNYAASSGVGTTYTKTFTYSGARTSSNGLGFLGFATRTEEDSRNSVTVEDDYKQSFPWIGQVTTETTKQSNGHTINQVVSTPDQRTSGSGYSALYFPYMNPVVSTDYDVASGAALKTVTTTLNTPDSYGDFTDVTVNAVDANSGATFKTEKQYSFWSNASASDYCINLVTQLVVTKTSPHGTMQRITGATPDSGYCRPAAMTVSQGTDSDTSITGTATPVTTTYSYDNWGNIKTETVTAADITSRTTSTEYSTYNGEYPDKITNALNQVSALSWYPNLGLKKTATDPNGHSTTWQYDGFGRLAKVIRPDQSSVSYAYASFGGSCPSGNGCYTITASAQSSAGQSIMLGSSTYDAEGRVIRQQKTLLGGVMSTVDTAYNNLGEVTKASKPYLGSTPGYWTYYNNYDVLGRPGQITQPANEKDASNSDVTSIAYDGFMTTSTLQAPNGSLASETSSRTTDAIGEVVNATDSNGTSTSYGYDAFGDLVDTNVNGQSETAMTYDGLGHKLTMTDPDMGHWTYTYDALGELLSQTDAKGQTVSQQYDTLGRIKTRTELDSSGTQTVADTWNYDTATNGIGLPASLSDSNGFSKQYGYDSLSRPDDLTTTIGGASYDVSTTYDSFGRVQTVTYPASVTPVTSPVPAAVASANPATIVLGSSLTLDGSGSTDPNGLPLQYSWSKAAGPGNMTVTDTDADEATTQASFSAPGNYTVQLIVRDAQGGSAPAIVSVTVKPPVPTGVSATHNNDTYGSSVLVKWTPMTVADSYDVYQSTDNVNFTYLGSSQGSTNASYLDSGLQDGMHYYKVVAVGGGVPSDQSAATSIDVEVPPTVPQSLTAPSSVSSSTSPETYTVSWSVPANTGGLPPAYVLEEENTLDTNPTFVPVYTSCNSVSSCTTSDVTQFSPSHAQDGIYVYQVEACNPTDITNASLCSNYTSQVNTHVTNPPTVPGTPQIPSSDEQSWAWVISWLESTINSGSTGSITYYLYQSFNGGSWTLAYSGSGNPDSGGTLWANVGGTTSGTYTYEIKACTTDLVTGGTACTDPAASVSAGYNTVIAPPAPTGVSVPVQSAWNGSFSVSWNEAANGITVTNYKVDLDANNDNLWKAGHCSSSTTSCTFIANQVPANTYRVRVEACDNGACSPETLASGTVTVWYLPVPAAPSLSGTTTTYTGGVSLSWSAPTNATSYQLYAQYYSTSSASWGSYALKYSGTSRSWSQTLTSDQKYAHYYVKACDQAGCSGASNTVTTTYSVPVAPSLSGPSSTSTGSVSLSWSKPTGTTSFKLYRSYENKYSVWSTPAVLYSGSATSYSDTLNSTWKAASYYVQACNAVGCSSSSNTVSVTYDLTGSGGCGKVLCFVMPDPDLSVLTRRRDLQAVPLVHAAAASPLAPLPDSTLVIRTQLALNSVEQPMAAPLPELDFNSGYNVTVFATLPEPVAPGVMVDAAADHGTLLALQQARQKLVEHTLHQASEQAMQAAATHRAEARFAALAPQVPAADRAAWAKWQQAQQRAYPNGPNYAPPAYIAYADARVKPAASTPYRFTVQYVYDDASGALAMVANADTGFIYWQADTDDGIAPVDAFGHLLAFTDGNGVSTVSTYDAATGSPTGISSGIDQTTNVQSLVYKWDGYGNLIQRQDANQTLSEGFQYDSLNRLTVSSVTNPAGTGPSLSMSYDALGNITCKSDVVGHACAPGSTDYTYDPSHPHAVQSIAGLPGTFQYDADGNMKSGNNLSNISWNVDNLPTEIQGPSGTSDFAYGPGHQRYLQTQSDGTVTTYVGGLYEVVSSNSGATIEYRHNILADGQVVAVHTLDQGGNAKTSYLHYDHLGSVDAITDDTGAVIQRISFDAFGQRRDATNWTSDLTAGDIASLKNTTDRGFTDQEQLDNVGLVHMNGRVYDPQIGRFISADPTVPNPMYSQAFNRYSYVYNSPLVYTDPSGFCPKGGMCTTLPGLPGTYNIIAASSGYQAPSASMPQTSMLPTVYVTATAITATNLDPASLVPSDGVMATPVTIDNTTISDPGLQAPGAPDASSNSGVTQQQIDQAEKENDAEAAGNILSEFSGNGTLQHAPLGRDGGHPGAGGPQPGNATNNTPHPTGVPTGPGRPGSQFSGTVGVGHPGGPTTPRPPLGPGDFMFPGGAVGMGVGAGAGAIGGSIYLTSEEIAAATEAAAAGEFGEAILGGFFTIDAIAGGAVAGALALCAPGMIVGAAIGLAIYGGYELYQHEIAPALGPKPYP